MTGAAVVLAAVLAGCGGSGASGLLEAAQLEETQRNPEHARELYQEILRRFPDAPEATTATTRLKALADER